MWRRLCFSRKAQTTVAICSRQCGLTVDALLDHTATLIVANNARLLLTERVTGGGQLDNRDREKALLGHSVAHDSYRGAAVYGLKQVEIKGERMFSHSKLLRPGPLLDEERQSFGLGLQLHARLGLDIAYLQHPDLEETYLLSARIGF